MGSVIQQKSFFWLRLLLFVDPTQVCITFQESRSALQLTSARPEAIIQVALASKSRLRPLSCGWLCRISVILQAFYWAKGYIVILFLLDSWPVAATRLDHCWDFMDDHFGLIFNVFLLWLRLWFELKGSFDSYDWLSISHCQVHSCLPVWIGILLCNTKDFWMKTVEMTYWEQYSRHTIKTKWKDQQPSALSTSDSHTIQ